MGKVTKTVQRLLALLISWLFPGLVFAQGCAACYTQAAGSGSRMIQALRSGIFTLIVPSVLLCVGITWMTYKKRNQFNEDSCEQSPDVNSAP